MATLRFPAKIQLYAGGSGTTGPTHEALAGPGALPRATAPGSKGKATWIDPPLRRHLLMALGVDLEGLVGTDGPARTAATGVARAAPGLEGKWCWGGPRRGQQGATMGLANGARLR